MQLPYLFPHNVPSSSGNESPDLPSISISNPQRFQIDRIRSTIERYKKASASTSGSAPVIDVNSHQYFQQEAAKLRQQIQTLQNSNRHLMGESIGNMTAKELKNLESRLERGIGRIRSKKVNHDQQHELLFAEIEYMQKREADLQNENMYLRAKRLIELSSRQHQKTTRWSRRPLAASTELQALPASFDPRGYYQQQVSMLAAASASSSQYSEHPGQEHHQTALHLGYHIKQVDAGKGLL
ncbi:hypothetical protein PR202_ga08700 [Eleusine coracana subsp. coracana]|uniref:K-box domain-containing protein n=1 Tax=Eleusine coracana subsp. coracana TaxID=191504 RepID=A0AAV5C3E7_ELECO|nr:hypothetical protein PR202_ga08700 [Eleusine coracana subsp. coracana]